LSVVGVAAVLNKFTPGGLFHRKTLSLKPWHSLCYSVKLLDISRRKSRSNPVDLRFKYKAM